MMRALLVAILTSTTPSLAARHDLKAGLEVSGPALRGVKQFMAWASENCVDCGSTIGSLVQGLDDAKFLKDSDWKSDDKTLTVTLTEDNLYGEIAAKSRLPIMWTLDKTCKFTFVPPASKGQNMLVQLAGIGLQPSVQGIDLYERAMKHSGLDPTKCIGDEECIKAEVKAAGKYLDDKWKTIKKEDGKITRLLMTTWDNFAIKMAVGKKKFAKIFYAMIVPSPLRLTSFVLKDGTMYATRDVVQDPHYLKYHMVKKQEYAGKENLLGNTGASKAIAEKYARSGFNFGRMMAFGVSEENRKELSKIGAADVSAIGNLFTWCANTKPDELPECKGSTPGRVGWAPYPKK